MLSIDPGSRALGWAIWDAEGALESCGCARSRKDTLGGRAHDMASQIPFVSPPVVVEEMRYLPGRVRSVPMDLLSVQAVGCLVAGHLSPDPVVLVPPSLWKGSVPKRIHHLRILSALTDTEKEIVDVGLATAHKNNAKEILDAIGIGLYALGRIERGGLA